jgi:hypothetical protein
MNVKKLNGDISKSRLAKLCGDLNAGDHIRIAFTPACEGQVRQRVQITLAKAGQPKPAATRNARY